MAKLALVLLSILAVLGASNAYKILVIFPLPARSHNNLGNGFVRNLLKAGHEITHVTAYPQHENNPKLREIDLSSNMDMLPKDLLNLSSMMKNNQNNAMRNYLFFMGLMMARKSIEHENFQKLLADPTEHFDLVIAEWMFSELYCGIQAIYDAPLILSSTIEPHWMILSIIDGYLNPAVNAYDSEELPPYSFTERVSELLFTIKQTVIRETIVRYLTNKEYYRIIVPHIEARGKVPPSFQELRYNASLVFGNSHVSMGEAVVLPQNYKPIGGYHIDDNIKPLPKDLQKLIDEAKHGVIYFSMGSNLKSKDIPEEIKKGLLKLFGTLKQIVIWKFEEELPNKPENVHILKWAPQQSILAHPNVRMFITHGGLLSTTETIYAGKPFIGIPVFSDQFINVARAVSRGFARKVDLSYTLPDNLKIAIEDILNNPKYAQRAKELALIHHDRPVKPGQELVHWSEHVIKTKGAPHLRSPALLVPWYQKMYLDLALLLLLLVLVLRSAYRRIKSVVFPKTAGKIKKN